MFGPPTNQKLDPEPLAVGMLLAMIAGFGLGFVKGKKGVVASAFLAGLGLVLLLALKSKLDSDALRQGGGAIQVQYEAGFYLVLLLLLAAVGAAVLAWLQARNIPLTAWKWGGPDKFCAQCGARNAASDLYCKECGAKFT
jgi:hypothetical protein